jgi:hypothetical protein
MKYLFFITTLTSAFLCKGQNIEQKVKHVLATELHCSNSDSVVALLLKFKPKRRFLSLDTCLFNTIISTINHLKDDTINDTTNNIEDQLWEKLTNNDQSNYFVRNRYSIEGHGAYFDFIIKINKEREIYLQFEPTYLMETFSLGDSCTKDVLLPNLVYLFKYFDFDYQRIEFTSIGSVVFVLNS